jgi:hypothetical protein
MARRLILLGTPRELRIPYYARGASRIQESSFTRLDMDRELTKLAGADCAVWVKARHDQEKLRLVETRNCLPLQTAVYAQWLLFENEAEALEFLEAFPRYDLDARISKISEELQTLTADLARRVIRRDFDLSRVGDERQRRNVARRYVEMTDKLRQLSTDLRLSETAKDLAREWQDKL